MTDADAPAPATMPQPRTRLIGRDAEVAAARARLLDDRVPLLTLTGPGGVGKTRLAAAIAAGVGAHARDGAAFVPLAPVRDPALVLPVIARALGVPDHPGVPVEVALADALRERRMLLVLDNLEQVAGAAPALGRLLEACPGLQMLATSRVRLQLGLETLLPVHPLPPPPDPEVVAFAAVAGSPAVTLFVERARAVLPEFCLTPENAATIVAIVERLDGLPLAIELAAARLPALSPEALLTHLEPRLRLLRGGRQDLPPRLRTMADAIAWSYDLLDAAEQGLLRRLGVFLGGWTLEAAAAVAGVDRLEVLDGIASLVDKSLIRPLPAPGGAPRYTMLETVREFSLEQLEAAGELAAAQAAHATWCLALAETCAPHLTGPEQGAWLDRLEIDHDNLRAALAWLAAEGDVDAGLRLATALLRLWDTRDYMSEGRGHLLGFLALAESGAAAVSPLAKARALVAASDLASWEAEHTVAADLATEALGIWRALGDGPGTANALWLLGVNTLALGDGGRAEALAAEGLALARQVGDRETEAFHLRLFGTAAIGRDDSAAAVPLLEAALVIWQELEDRAERCSDLGALAMAAGQLGERAWAIGLWAESLALAREVGEDWMVAYFLEGHAELALATGQPHLSVRWLGAAD
ncbi:MAG: hypothetical protein QM692_22400, partial [Thermomicrobiales bacterium]